MHSGPASTHATPHRVGGIALTLLGLAAIAWLTLRPNAAPLAATQAACCSAPDVLLNILLYLPLGAGLALLGIRPRSAVVIGALLSAGIELAQRSWLPGRFASPYDVASNVAGCLVGILIVTQWDRRANWWPVVAPGIALVVVLAWLLGGYLAQPAIPGPSRWVAQVAQPPAGMAVYRGTVLDPRLQGEPLPPGPVGGVAALRARLAASRKVEFDVTIVTGEAPAKRASLFEIVVGEGTVPFLILDQEGGTLLAFQRTGLSWVGLRGPWLTLKDALPLTAGDTVQVRLEATRRHLRLVAMHDGLARETAIRLSPELYFGALTDRVTDGAVRWTFIPAVASFVLLGLAMASRPRLLVLVGVVALIVSPVGGGCALPAWTVALGCCGGAGAGRWIGLRLALFGS